MPFRSNKQRRYLWSKRPDIARTWTSKYGAKAQPKPKPKPKRRK